MRIQFRTELFNAFNHPNWANPNTTANGPFAGQNLDAVLFQNWDNQTIFEVGAAYQASDMFTIRFGANTGNNPVPDRYLNCLFPAIVERHRARDALLQARVGILAHPLAHACVQRVLQHLPFEVLLVLPFALLAELAADIPLMATTARLGFPSRPKMANMSRAKAGGMKTVWLILGSVKTCLSR